MRGWQCGQGLLDAIHSAGAIHSEVDALQGVVDAGLRSVQLPHFLHAHSMRFTVSAP